MKIDDFMRHAVIDIKSAIDDLNIEEEIVKDMEVGYPETVEFDLCVAFTTNGLEVVDEGMQNPHNPSRLKLTINLSTYSGE